MEKSLYRKICSLRNTLQEKNNEAAMVMWSDGKKSEKFKNLIAEKEKIEEELEKISREYPITPLMMSDIITSYMKDDYQLKLFRETANNGEFDYYTERFIVCYLNKSNEFYSYDQGGKVFPNLRGLPTEQYINYPLDTSTYKHLLDTLDGTGSIVLANSDECSFRPCLPPSDYIEGINFTRMLTQRTYYDSVETDEFIKLAGTMLKYTLDQVMIESEHGEQGAEKQQ